MHQQSEPLSCFADVECDGKSVTDSAGCARSNYTSEACNTLPGLEGAHAVRSAFKGNQRNNADGCVQYQSQPAVYHGSQQSTEPNGKQVQASLSEPANKQTFERVLDRTDECIRLEAIKMQIKHSSLVNTATDVVFRSDFMTFCDTRVSICETIRCRFNPISLVEEAVDTNSLYCRWRCWLSLLQLLLEQSSS